MFPATGVWFGEVSGAKGSRVRTKSDLEWSNHPGSPGCHRCGLPLLEDASYCPYCERRLRENAVVRVVERGRALVRSADGRRILGLPERAFYAAGALTFAGLAIASAVLALLV